MRDYLFKDPSSSRAVVPIYGYKQTGMVDEKRLRVARSVTLWNGQPAVVQQDLERTWAYDDEGRMRGLTYPAAARPAGGSYTFGYNSMGQPSSMSDGTNGIVNADVVVRRGVAVVERAVWRVEGLQLAAATYFAEWRDVCV